MYRNTFLIEALFLASNSIVFNSTTKYEYFTCFCIYSNDLHQCNDNNTNVIIKY